jgi:hypothetical protein
VCPEGSNSFTRRLPRRTWTLREERAAAGGREAPFSDITKVRVRLRLRGGVTSWILPMMRRDV